MTAQQKIDRIHTASDEEVVSSLGAPQFLVRAKAIEEVASRRLNTTEAVKALTLLLHDDQVFWKPYRISHMARAALHTIGIEPYSGNDPAVVAMIKQFQH